MRKLVLYFTASIAVTVLGATLATADNLDFITSGQNHYGNYFTYNDTVHWGVLGNGFAVVPNGTTVWSSSGIATTITFGFGEPGMQFQQGYDWSGNFAPGQYVLTNFNPYTYYGDGTLNLSFGQGVAAAGFQIQANLYGPFQAEIGVYDGSTLLGTFFGTGDSTANNDNSAVFFGVTDLTGADITSIKIAAYHCAYGDTSCAYGFGINHLELQDNSTSGTPEPADLALVGSGLAALAYLRRRFSARK